MPNQIQQLMIVLCGLAALPLVCRILAKLKLLPLAVYFLLTRLLFPQWAGEHETLCAVLLAVLAAFTLARWLIWLGSYAQHVDGCSAGSHVAFADGSSLLEEISQSIPPEMRPCRCGEKQIPQDARPDGTKAPWGI